MYQLSKRLLSRCLLGFVPCLALFGLSAGSTQAGSYQHFDGRTYVQVPNSSDFSVATTGQLTVSAWIRPDTLHFDTTEGSGYVWWLGKGSAGQQEWAFRMYSDDNTEGRGNRISFYVFNAQGGLGIGSYFQDQIVPGQWIHVTAVVDEQTTAIYKNGVFRSCDQYRGPSDGHCQQYTGLTITPQAGTAPLRIGTRDLHSFFQGSIADVRIWNRALSANEIASLYAYDLVPANGLVADYPLLQSSGTLVRDATGNHDGTLLRAP